MTNLTPEERILGRENADRAIGMTRRDWLIAAAATPTLAGFYFGYKDMGNKPPVKAAIIGTGDEGCQAMIRSHNRDYLNFIGFCDIRPSQQERAVKEFSNHKQYTAADVKKLKKYDDQGADARRPRRRDDRHRAALVAARAGGDRGDEGRQARLHREADGPLDGRVQGDVPGRPRDEQAAGRRPPAALLGRSTTTPTSCSRTACWATSATSGPSGIATTPSRWSRKDKDNNTDLRPQDRPARDRARRARATSSIAIAGSGPIPRRTRSRLRQVWLQEPGRADQLAALQPHRRRADGRAGLATSSTPARSSWARSTRWPSPAWAAHSSTRTAARSTTTSSRCSNSHTARTTRTGWSSPIRRSTPTRSTATARW